MDETNYTATQVANFFIEKAVEEGKQMSHIKLQKLVYIGYGWALALLGKELFREPIMAWKHGPVIDSVYHSFKHYGRRMIDKPAQEFDLDEFDIVTRKIPDTDTDVSAVLTKVWDVYKNFSAWSLVEKTHEEGTPWKASYTGERHIKIPVETISSHFKFKIDQYLAAIN